MENIVGVVKDEKTIGLLESEVFVPFKDEHWFLLQFFLMKVYEYILMNVSNNFLKRTIFDDDEYEN